MDIMKAPISEMRGQEMDYFNVARMHGMNAILTLAAAYKDALEYDRAVNAENEEAADEERFFQSAGAAGAHRRRIGAALTFKLFSTVINYQASMEALVSNSPHLAHAQGLPFATALETAVNEGGFARKWRGALGAVGEDTTEFDRYEQSFYQDMRIPLTHLDRNHRLAQIDAISFEKVYKGVRDGWYAHARLIRAVGYGPSDIDACWEHISTGNGLPHDLFI